MSGMTADLDSISPDDSTVVKNAALELSEQTSGSVVIRCDQNGNQSSNKPRLWIGDFDTNVNQIGDSVLDCTHDDLAGMHHSPPVKSFFSLVFVLACMKHGEFTESFPFAFNRRRFRCQPVDTSVNIVLSHKPHTYRCSMCRLSS
eukprot:SAG11_NODE_2345_length_3487_cov_1.677981_4_plen_145_part_00